MPRKQLSMQLSGISPCDWNIAVPCKLTRGQTWVTLGKGICFAWWRHQMETFSALLTLCAAIPPVTGGYPSQRPVTRSFDVFFDLRLNKRLSKQSRRRWFETPSRSLWHHCNCIFISICEEPSCMIQDSRFKHRLFRRNTNIHIYISIMDTWQNMFLNGNKI